MKRALPVHEWSIIVLFCALLLLLAAFALGGASKGGDKTLCPPPKQTFLQVRIEGAIAHPGIHQLPLRTTLKHLIEQAKPLSTADLSQLNMRRKLYDGQTIRIPSRHPIKIVVTGAVKNPGHMEIESGTRFCDLVEELELLPEADLKSVRKKRGFVLEGENVHIPLKGEKKRAIKTSLDEGLSKEV